jgi:serine/threonine protein kinase
VKLIGSYQVLGLLGRGGMAAVYKVRHRQNGEMAALKLFAPREELVALWGRKEAARRFVAEAEIISGLEHPNLIQVRERGEHQGRPYYTMDYLCRDLALVMGEGMRLEDPTRALDLGQALDCMKQILSGLEALHAAGLVHRDIKPGNLLVTHQSGLKICDFGLAKTRQPGIAAPSGLLLGSPFYAAPEQEKDPAAAGPAADLYSAGVVLLRMLTGRLWLKKGQKPSSLHGDLNNLWDDFFDRALALEPGERFSDAADMSRALIDLESDWQRRMETTCMQPPLTKTPVHAACPHRSRPEKVPLGMAQEAFGLDRFWRPDHIHDSGFHLCGEDLVEDKACGLIWQRSGGPEYLTWHEAHDYVAALNLSGFGGVSAWRLPTVDEAATLLRPPAQQKEHCLDPMFSRAQDWIWTCDRSAFTSAWLASLLDGFVTRLDFSCLAQVRAVAGHP